MGLTVRVECVFTVWILCAICFMLVSSLDPLCVCQFVWGGGGGGALPNHGSFERVVDNKNCTQILSSVCMSVSVHEFSSVQASTHCLYR